VAIVLKPLAARSLHLFAVVLQFQNALGFRLATTRCWPSASELKDTLFCLHNRLKCAN
jgi:hypothetical protein